MKTLLLALLLCAPALAQSQPRLATTEDGQKVRLYPDGRWEAVKEARTDATLNIEAGLVMTSGRVVPLARETFYLLDDDLFAILKAAKAVIPESARSKYLDEGAQIARAIAMALHPNATGAEANFGRAVKEAIQPHIVKAVTTSFDGKASVQVEPGRAYFLFGASQIRSEVAIWNLRVRAAPGHQSVTIDHTNLIWPL